MAENSPLPLRRIVRADRILLSRSVATRPRIGRLASGSQALANSLGRPATMRRSMSEVAPVKYPSWLLPSLSGRSDELDPWRDRDLIAIRRARSRNRVVRTIPPRGLPMASHANGRGRLGEQVAPSSIARRLQPVRRAPSPNDAHVQVARQPAVRPATPRPPRSRRLALPPGKSGDRDAPAAELHPDTRPAASTSTRGSRALPLASVIHRQRAMSESTPRRNFSDPMPKVARPSIGGPSSSSDRSDQPKRSDAPVRRSQTHVDSGIRRTPNTSSSTSSLTSTTSRAVSERSTGGRPASDRSRVDLSRPRPDWTTFGGVESSDSPSGAPQSATSSLSVTNDSDGNARMIDARSHAGRTPRNAESTAETSAVPSTRTRGVIHRSLVAQRSSIGADWRNVIGLRSRAERADTPMRREASTPQSTLAQRVAALADPSGSPRTPGHLVRRSPVAGSLISLAAAVAAARPVAAATSTSVTPSPSRAKGSNRSADAIRRSPSRPPVSNGRIDATRRPSARSVTTNDSAEGSLRPPSARSAPGPRASFVDAPHDLWRRTVSSPRSEAISANRRGGPSSLPTNFSRPGDVARSRSLEGFTPSSVARRRHSMSATNAAVRRVESQARLSAHSITDRVLRSQSRGSSPTSILVPGGSASSPFVGVLARAVAARQVGAPSSRSNGTPTTSAQSLREQTRGFSSDVRTGPGREAAQSFSERLARRLSDDSTLGATADFGEQSEAVGRTGIDSAIVVPSKVGSSERSAGGELIARSTAARASTSPGFPILDGVVQTASTSTSGPSSTSIGTQRGSDSSGRSRVTSDPSRPSSSRGLTYRAATPPRPARVRRSVALDDLPVAPIVVPPQREVASSSPADDPKGTQPNVGSDRSSRRPGGAARQERAESTRAVRSSRSGRTLNVRRASTGADSSTTSPSDTVTADALARMIENGFEPDFTRTVTRRVDGTTSAPVRRSPSTNGARTNTGSTLIRRSPSSELSRTSANPSSIIASAIGGAEVGDGEAGRVTTSQLLDLIDWINRVVEEKLRLELERRGMSGGRW